MTRKLSRTGRRSISNSTIRLSTSTGWQKFCSGKPGRGRRPCRTAGRPARRPVTSNENRLGFCADLY